MTKLVPLDTIGSISQNPTSAQTLINSNSDKIGNAIFNTLSRDGSAPNQMEASMDMNSQRILNLPQPATANEPLRLQDLSDFVGGGTVTNIPIGGTTGQSLKKNSNANYDIGWGNTVSSVGLALPAADFTITGSPVTGTGTLTGSYVNTPTGTGGFVRATSPTLVTPALGTPSAINLANATNLPVGSIAGMGASVATFLTTPSSANLKTAVTDETGSGGSLVFATGPTLSSPVIGTIVNGGNNLTLPSTTDTLVGRATTDTLTNKTLTSPVLTTPVINGTPTGTGVNVAPGVSTLVLRDSAASIFATNIYRGYTTTATAAGTTTLNSSSNWMQVFTGVTTQFVVLPVSATLQLGFQFFIDNQSTGVITVQSSAGTTIVAMPPNTAAEFTCILTSGTTPASWTYYFSPRNGQLAGIGTAGGDASSGNVGEFISASVQSGSAVSLTTATPANITNIVLPAGDWDIQGSMYLFGGVTTTLTWARGSISTTSATEVITVPNYGVISPNGATPFNGNDLSVIVPLIRVSITGSTQYFLVARANFGVSTCTAYGHIRARRVR